MPQRMTIMLVAVGLVFAAIFGFEAFRARMIQKAIVSMRNPQQTVSTITAGTQDWQDQMEAVGSARAEKGADLSPQVSGIVKAIHFQSGEKVEQGAMLVELEDGNDDPAEVAQKVYANFLRDIKTPDFQQVVEIIAQQLPKLGEIYARDIAPTRLTA